MQQRIGVGMAGQPAIVGNLDAAQNQLSAALKTVYIKSMSYA